MFKGQSNGESLYDTLLTVTVDVENVGEVVACEVAQLVSFGGRYVIRALFGG